MDHYWQSFDPLTFFSTTHSTFLTSTQSAMSTYNSTISRNQPPSSHSRHQPYPTHSKTPYLCTVPGCSFAPTSRFQALLAHFASKHKGLAVPLDMMIKECSLCTKPTDGLTWKNQACNECNKRANKSGVAQARRSIQAKSARSSSTMATPTFLSTPQCDFTPLDTPSSSTADREQHVEQHTDPAPVVVQLTPVTLQPEPVNTTIDPTKQTELVGAQAGITPREKLPSHEKGNPL